VLATDLAVGRSYAHRAKPNDAESLLRKIIFVGSVRAGKAKVRHADGDLDGLEEWVPTRTVMCGGVNARHSGVMSHGGRCCRKRQPVTSTL
jgi:hypothetical protein